LTDGSSDRTHYLHTRFVLRRQLRRKQSEDDKRVSSEQIH
jgi:hypothetical protein